MLSVVSAMKTTQTSGIAAIILSAFSHELSECWVEIIQKILHCRRESLFNLESRNNRWEIPGQKCTV